MEPLRSGGSLFKKSELVECSLVAVPANANAISIAKSLGISVSVQDMIFAKPGKEDHVASGRRIIGKSAARTIEHHERSAAMVPIAQRIIEAENHLNALRDDFNAHLEQVDDLDVSDADVETRNEFNAKIALATRNLDSLRQAEKNISVGHPEGGGGGTVQRSARQSPRPFGLPQKKVDPLKPFFFDKMQWLNLLWPFQTETCS